MNVMARHAEQAAVFVLLLILEGVFWTPSTYFGGPHPNVWANDPYSTAFNIALIGFLAVAFVLRAGMVLPVLRLAWPMLPLLVLAYASFAWSALPSIALVHAVKVTLVTLFGIYLLARGEMANVIALFVKANFAAAVLCFVVFAVARPLVYSATVPLIEHAWRGVFSDKNGLGINAAIGIIFAVYAFRPRYGSRVVSGLAVPANLLLLYLSQSRTSLVLVLVAFYVALTAGTLRRRSGFGLVLGFGLVVLGLAGAALALGFAGDLLAALGRDPSLSQRTRIWATALPFVAHRPWFGYGFGNFWLPQSQQANIVWGVLNWKAPSAHNGWLQLALDLGVVGCFLAAFVWLAAFGRGLRLLFVPAAREVAFAWVLLTALFVENLTEYAFFNEGWVWALFCAVFVHLGRELQVRRAGARAAPASAMALPAFPLAVPR